ncbi:hypothetical protein U1Q18_029995 [Sarracenia purpurea var. burkii]
MAAGIGFPTAAIRFFWGFFLCYADKFGSLAAIGLFWRCEDVLVIKANAANAIALPASGSRLLDGLGLILLLLSSRGFEALLFGQVAAVEASPLVLSFCSVRLLVFSFALRSDR